VRILVPSYEFPPLGGGGAKVVAGLCREIAQHGHQVDVVTMGFRGLPEHEQIDGVDVHRVPCVRAREDRCHTHEMATYLLGAWPVLRDLTKRRSYDLIHAHFILPDGILAARLHHKVGIPYVITAHGSDVPGFNPDRFRFQHKVIAPLWRSIVRPAAAIACPSEFLAGLIRAAGAKGPIDIVPNGFDPSRYDSKPDASGVLAVTRMFERKGIQYLIEALEGVNKAPPTNIVGDGPYLESLKQLATGRDIPVNFWGWVDNDSDTLRDLYEGSNIFVFPSESENFPIVLLEAMSAGMAIVTTQGTGCEEVVGKAAMLVPARDARALREVLEQLTDEPETCAQLVAAARQRLVEHFSWTAVGRRYLDLYQSCV